jgi:copper chaperone CopZ
MTHASARVLFSAPLIGIALAAGCDCSSCDSGDAPNAAAQPALPTMDGQSAPAAAAAAATIAVSFEVKGMHCNGCAEAVAEETRGIPGVTAVVVSFDESRADVTLLEGADAGAVETAIRKLGYTVSRRN